MKPLLSLARSLPLFALALTTQAHALDNASLNGWTALYKGVDYTTGFATGVTSPTNSTPRSHAINAMRIDLRDPDIRFFSTPGNGSVIGDTNAQTTSDFLEAYDLQVAINANFFSPCCAASPDPKDVLGLAISNGSVVSPSDYNAIPPGGSAYSLALTAGNEALIKYFAPGADVSMLYTAVSGGPLLLSDGQILVAEAPQNSFYDSNPRTAVGLSADARYLYLLTVDGRQPGYSDGATLYETAEWLQLIGATQGLNLDGGGSTAMVRADVDGNAVLLNKPSGRVERYNANNFGLYAAALPAVPEPSAWALMMFGMLVLLAASRRLHR
ncbi:phosphodiester glycosidase family protein [Methyloversatilis thermotolerans]|uniref:phosphodiester glycosidase family protein n=1 Tax=Methyloversatilis thermotolerans TaxID=1346290 RepID=UPI000379AF51|nr:phosphodiester glycosidase family protein [Methyloversatilis thermotolerans]